MTRRQTRISRFVLAVAFAGLGIWALAKGDHLPGALYLSFSVAWLLLGVFGDRIRAGRSRRDDGPSSGSDPSAR